MSPQFLSVSTSCDWDNTPGYYRLDPQLYLSLATRTLPAFKAMPEAESIIVVNVPDSTDERFGSTDTRYSDREDVLGEVVVKNESQTPQKVFAFDLDEDCQVTWQFQHLEIRRPYNHHETHKPIFPMRLEWRSKHTAETLSVQFDVELPEAATELTGEIK